MKSIEELELLFFVQLPFCSGRKDIKIVYDEAMLARMFAAPPHYRFSSSVSHSQLHILLSSNRDQQRAASGGIVEPEITRK